MELPSLTITGDGSSAPFEWSDLVDFSIDDQLFANFDAPDHWNPHLPMSSPPLPPPPAPQGEPLERVRKRDPRLVCENFLAGRVPCACPEMDAKMEEEEERENGGPRKKQARTARTPGVVRCQVKGCEADIGELKGYHRRHRVCLRCANATSVVIDGESKRYCQQCGKFHVLSDFDEGKRSCRRKLERHNNRRRRKPVDHSTVGKEYFGDLQSEYVSSDGEAGRENTWSSCQNAQREVSRDGSLSNLYSALESQNIETDSVVTFTQVEKAIDDSKLDHSPPSYDNKSTYSSVCPTGRISFKLYDWNPAEFPRRLRHQIFQWLASMPVELEGYIRPGCTILTAFVSMPQFMWLKLFEDPICSVRRTVMPGGMLSGKGTALVYLNNTSFRVVKDGASITRVNVAVRAPKLHYVYPPCFEAGKPMDFIACGSNLIQPNFRSLISFAGKYLPHDYHVAFPHGTDKDESTITFGNQFCRIFVPHTEPSFCGPAFIEVENEHGLSNFIPVIVGDEHVCSEITMIHREYDCSNCKKEIRSGCSSPTCEILCSRRKAFSEFMLDVAWLLKWPHSEKLHQIITSSQIQRFNCMLNFLISKKSVSILERILRSMQITLEEVECSNETNSASDCNVKLFKECLNRARYFLHHGAQKDKLTVSQSRDPITKVDGLLRSSVNDMASIDHPRGQIEVVRANANSLFTDCQQSKQKWETVSLLNGEVSMNFTDNRESQSKSCSLMLSRKFVRPRPLIYMIAAIALCAGVCAVVYHPSKVGNLAVTIRRCLFDNSL